MTTVPPLLDVAMSYVRSSCPTGLSDDSYQTIRDSFQQFFAGMLPHDHLALLLHHHFGNAQPLDRIDTILQVPPDPPAGLCAEPPPDPLGARKKPRPWSTLEDTRLLAGIHRFGIENWSSVAQFVGTSRTRAQCTQRWVRGLDPRISKDQWSAQDEEQLLALVREKGTRMWTQIAAGMGNRSDVQCRYHFFQMYRDGKLPPDLAALVAQDKMAEGSDGACVFRARSNSLGSRGVPVRTRAPPPPPFPIPKQSGFRQRPPLPPTATATQQRRLSLPKTEFPRVAPREHRSDGETIPATDRFGDSNSDVPESPQSQPGTPHTDLLDWTFDPTDEFDGSSLSGTAGWW
jgi:hypothetical protein